MKKAAAIILLFIYSSACLAHGGGLDQYGCHNDNVNGGHHCHNGSSSSSSSSSADAGAVVAVIAGIFLIVWLFGKANGKYLNSSEETEGTLSIAPVVGNDKQAISLIYRF